VYPEPGYRSYSTRRNKKKKSRQAKQPIPAPTLPLDGKELLQRIQVPNELFIVPMHLKFFMLTAVLSVIVVAVL
jgi:hypothetical protein